MPSLAWQSMIPKAQRRLAIFKMAAMKDPLERVFFNLSEGPPAIKFGEINCSVCLSVYPFSFILYYRPSKHKKMHNIYTILDHRHRRWADVINALQMFCVCCD